MPYQESPYFDTPSHTKTLWRYMHIDKFMSMLKSQLIYFPKITVFNDIYEGELSDKSRTEVYKTNLLNDNNTPIEQDDVFRRRKEDMELYPDGLEKKQILSLIHSFDTLLTKFSKHLMFCNCWFLSDNESHSMWAEYGDKSPTSIAIQTTVGDLINSLKMTEFDIHIGTVKYKDYENEHIEGYEDFTSIDLNKPENVLQLFYAPIMHKRNVYADEHEVRSVISFDSICNKYLDRIYTSNIPFYNDKLFEYDFSLFNTGKTNILKDIPKEGLNINVNLGTLIKTVAMSPYSNGYFDEPLRKLMDDNNLNGGLVRISQIAEVLEKVSLIE